ncbi:hypothetical protein JQC67_08005 [Aurantibacter crassamenti]|uniref:hypothetical protein n=1 Tax=Aurantibacter crassamenti TaxID=1837375 RepID=UPI00193AA44D|nr:hypothetical protein [Aurantibacter crassamenti]MBM1106074.1 hypothetical protein [Aurantibacter crassamenti]
MNVFRRIFDFYLDASIHVALSVYSLVWLSGYMLNISIDIDLALFLFFGSIASYNFVKYGLEAEKYILVANRYHKNIQFLSIIALGLACFHAYYLNYDTWIGLIVLSILTGLYAIPVLPHAKNLRSLSGFKIVVVALVWSGATVLLPIFQIESNINWDVEIETIQRFLMVLVLLLPFEIRDLRYDPPELKTVPQRYGVRNTKKIGVVLVVIILMLTFFKDNLQLIEILVKISLSLSLILAVLITSKTRSKYYASFWVESLPIFWLAIAWVLREIF